MCNLINTYTQRKNTQTTPPPYTSELCVSFPQPQSITLLGIENLATIVYEVKMVRHIVYRIPKRGGKINARVKVINVGSPSYPIPAGIFDGRAHQKAKDHIFFAL